MPLEIKTKISPALKQGGGLLPAEKLNLGVLKTPVDILDSLKKAAQAASASEGQIGVMQIPTDNSQSKTVVAEKKQSSATVVVKTPDGVEQEVTELIGEPALFSGPTCEVGIEAGCTLNIGNYQSVRLGVTVKIPCAHTELDSVAEFAEKWVNDKLTLMTDKVKQAKEAAF